MIGQGDKILYFTKLFFAELHKVSSEGGLDHLNKDDEFFLNLLDKLTENLAGVGTLLKLSEKPGNSYLRNSMYLILRGVLSDCIIIIWLFYKEKGEENSTFEESIKKKILHLRRDHIKFHLSYMRKRASLNLLPDDEKDFDLQLINSYYKDLLTQEIGNDLKDNLPDSISITKMLNEFTKENPALVDAHTYYFILSKIEHSGEFTRMMLEKTYGEKNPMDQFVLQSIFIAENVIKQGVKLFLKDEKFLKEFDHFNVVPK